MNFGEITLQELNKPAPGWLSPSGKFFPAETWDPQEIPVLADLIVKIYLPEQVYCGISPEDLLLFCGWVAIRPPSMAFASGRRLTKIQQNNLLLFKKLSENNQDWVWVEAIVNHLLKKGSDAF